MDAASHDHYGFMITHKATDEEVHETGVLKTRRRGFKTTERSDIFKITSAVGRGHSQSEFITLSLELLTFLCTKGAVEELVAKIVTNHLQLADVKLACKKDLVIDAPLVGLFRRMRLKNGSPVSPTKHESSRI